MCKFFGSIVCLVTWLGLAVCCDVTDVAVYRVTMRSLSSEGTFPKDYPIAWSKAQWYPLFGQSHNSSYVLYREGDFVSEPFNQLVQFGRVDELTSEADADSRVYDQFTADPRNGEAGLLMVDGSSHMVSAACPLAPGGRFAGVDSLDLCIGGGWLEQITLDLLPLSVGAARGPRTPVARGGPAGHQPVAKMEFVKMKEYTTKEMNELARERMATILQQKKHLNSDVTQTKEEYDDISEQDSGILDLEEEPVGTPRPGNPDDAVVVVTAGVASTSSPRPVHHESQQVLSSMDEAVLAVARGRVKLRGRLPRHFRSRLHHAVNRVTYEDCQVSSWGPWSTCSVSCGVGTRSRVRTVVNAPTPRGRACPDTRETESCSTKPCRDDYYEW